MVQGNPLDEAMSSVPRYSSEGDPDKQARWETKCVKIILNALGSFDAARLATESFDKTGIRQIRFIDFLSEYPDFPVFLHFRKIPDVYKTDHKEYFDKKWPNNAAVRSWEYLEGELPANWEGPRGLVFEWLHSGGPVKVIHNCNSKCVGQQWKFALETESHSEIMTIENFPNFLKSVGWPKS